MGTDSGVFASTGPAFTQWLHLGTGLPNAPVFHVEYNIQDKVLLVGTLGRGAWSLRFGGNGPPKVESFGSRPTTGRLMPVSMNRELMRSPVAGAVIDPQVADDAPFQLSPGVVVDPKSQRIFLMSTKGGIDAVAIPTGEQVWSRACSH